MKKVNIIVVCGSGVAMAMHAAYKLREHLEREKIYDVFIEGTGNNNLAACIDAYDMIVSNAEVTVKTDKPIFSAIPFITGVSEEELVKEIVAKVKEIQEKNNGS